MNSKQDRIKAELKSLVTDKNYHSLIDRKVDWLFDLHVPLKLVSNKTLFRQLNIEGGGKVTWDKNQMYGKKPLEVMLNVLDFKELSLLSAFVHECGHVKDKDNLGIVLETQSSEVSAWKHALVDFESTSPSNENFHEFFMIVQKCLATYNVSISSLNELKSYSSESMA